ncbi:unnamed protein product [Phaeothamnion confervicola]
MAAAGAPASGARIADELVALATETAGRLESVWNEVGYSSKEKEKQLESLREGFRKACATKISEEEGVRDHFLRTIDEARAEARAVVAALSDRDDDAARAEADASFVADNLTETLAHLECLLDGLRARRTERHERFLRAQRSIFLLCEELGEAPKPDFVDLDADLSEARLRRFEAQVDELNRATEHRMQTVAELVLACQALMNQLKIVPDTGLDLQIAGSLLPISAGSGGGGCGGNGHGGCGFSHLHGGSGGDEGAAPRLVGTRQSPTCVGASLWALEAVSTRHGELSAERDRRKARLEAMGEEILELWQRTGVPQEEQDKFSASVDGMGVETIAAGERELRRLRTLYAGMRGALLARAHARVAELWGLTTAPMDQRTAFAPTMDAAAAAVSSAASSKADGDAGVADGDEATAAAADASGDGGSGTDSEGDLLLGALEAEAARLETLHERMKPLLERVAEREELAAERWRHETAEKDSGRLKGRGAEEQKALQRELELEKRIKKRLPALNDRLRKVRKEEGKEGIPDRGGLG